MDPEQNTTTDLLATKRLRTEIDRIAAQAAALHAAHVASDAREGAA
jgi:hypothetical protein